ncbi:hypothetical protein HAX54_041714 [Datura stramonium]|uniref:Uncharacterized protein n=1 Tax=Datura stramonium TaxID=4076 RepID=A0ABS8SLH3_DATST|nr:hypothetical protein [Datura stramonium]
MRRRKERNEGGEGGAEGEEDGVSVLLVDAEGSSGAVDLVGFRRRREGANRQGPKGEKCCGLRRVKRKKSKENGAMEEGMDRLEIRQWRLLVLFAGEKER